MKVVVEGRPRCCSKCGDVAVRGYDGLIDKRHQCQGTRVRSWTLFEPAAKGIEPDPSRQGNRVRSLSPVRA